MNSKEELSEADKTGLDLLRTLTDVSRETQGRLTTYIRLLRQWQGRMNLIAPSTLSQAWERHIADSVQTVLIKPSARHWVDIGSGAGFPGLIAAILLADSGGGEVHLVESVRKKGAFMGAVIRETGIRNAGVDVTVHSDRIEKVLPELKTPDVVSARALASLSRLFQYSEHHLREGATGLFSKGQEHLAEIEEASAGWDFDLTIHNSRFEKDSVILEIHNLKKKSS